MAMLKSESPRPTLLSVLDGLLVDWCNMMFLKGNRVTDTLLEGSALRFLPEAGEKRGVKINLADVHYKSSGMRSWLDSFKRRNKDRLPPTPPSSSSPHSSSSSPSPQHSPSSYGDEMSDHSLTVSDVEMPLPMSEDEGELPISITPVVISLRGPPPSVPPPPLPSYDPCEGSSRGRSRFAPPQTRFEAGLFVPDEGTTTEDEDESPIFIVPKARDALIEKSCQ